MTPVSESRRIETRLAGTAELRPPLAVALPPASSERPMPIQPEAEGEQEECSAA
jgi:hypothetical protein